MECRLPDYGEIWKNHVLASESPRMKDDAAEEQFWQRFIEGKQYCPDAASRRVLQYLRPILQKYGIHSALEFGPGWGNYTLDLAKLCGKMTCVDISSHVLAFIDRTAKEHGIPEISLIHSKWEDFEPEEKYDLVFGYNCFYRQADLKDCFRKMNRAGRKLCVVGMNTGTLPRWAREIEAAGGRLSWDFKDYVYFSGVLYQMGICANVRVLPFEKELVYESREALVSGELQRCSITGAAPEKAAEILCRYFKEQKDGTWRGSAGFHSGIVWWEPAEAEENPETERFLRT